MFHVMVQSEGTNHILRRYLDDNLRHLARLSPKNNAIKLAKGYKKMPKKEITKNTGRPSKYKPAFNDLAYKLTLLGHTDKELASFFEIAESTLYDWKIKFPEFSESIKRGKEPADSKVVKSLFDRALGFKKKVKKAFKLKRVFYDDKGRRCEEEYMDHVYDEVYFPAETTAIIYWLNNRQREYWKNRQEHGFSQDNKLQQLLDLEDKRVLSNLEADVIQS